MDKYPIMEKRDSKEVRFLGASKVSTNYRISLTKETVEALGPVVGEYLLFYLDKETGAVTIRKA